MKIILATIDDVGLALLKEAATPNIDRVLRESAIFSRFVAAPNCSNFRAKVETGLYSIRYPGNGVGRIVKKSDAFGLEVDGRPVLARALDYMGKTAVQIGKWHLSAIDDLEHRLRAGYKMFSGSQWNLGPETYLRWTATESFGNGEVRNTVVDEHATSWTATAAAWAMDSGYDFIECSFNAAHKPYPDGSDQRALLEHLDGELGAVFAAVERYGYGMILVSDGGGTKTDGGKNNLSHTALATTCAAWRLPVVARDLVDTTDLYATIMDGVGGLGSMGWQDGLSLFAPGHRSFAFADMFPSLTGPAPGAMGQEMATDGELKVVVNLDTQEVNVTTWNDELTNEDTGFLLRALSDRRTGALR